MTKTCLFEMREVNKKGWITDPESKAKSVGFTEEGFKMAEALFQKHFNDNQRSE